MSLTNDDVISTLNYLLESCRDGEYGFSTSAEHIEDADLKSLLRRHASECQTAGQELQVLIRQLGGEPDKGGFMAGALHRGWVSVRGAVSRHDDQALLEECGRGEDLVVASYRKALTQELPLVVRNIVENQAQGAQKNFDEIKALRDSHTAVQ